MKRLEKARRVFKLMITTVKQYVADLGLSPELEMLMHDLLIPGLYLQKAAKKAKGAAERFFESKPNDLFKYLLDSRDILARPAKARRVGKMEA